ncbi:linear amide C-N hydrolase [Zwartia panacis]|uniref:linear amide C-N hydrolase n=1 Tax=Zwartia panacis TaxID=2683345 RepID=UPI0025B2E722|nr:linear amide C-N hydrolase [Zwartia panacis]MDN4017749.1 linear amide C-N hydrolase [Zwartia panacis]
MKQFSVSTLSRAIAGICLIAFAHHASACTAVNVSAKDGAVIAGRTMEWAYDMQWTLKSVPVGSAVPLTAPSKLKLAGTELKSKFAFIAVMPAILKGADAFLEGQNSAGLGMSGNFLPGFTEYQAVTAGDKDYVSILNLGRFVLGMFDSVKALRAELPKYKVWFDPAEVSCLPTPPWLHFVFTDRSGDSIVVEFVKGQMVISDNVAQVLTNSPTYDWHVLNLRNYLSLAQDGKASVPYRGGNVTALGQGGALLGLPGDYQPSSRFVRAAYLRHLATTPANASEASQLAVHVLNNVDIPVGVVSSKEGGQTVSDYTQWVMIKDLTNNRVMIANDKNRANYVTLDLNQIFSAKESFSTLIDALPYQPNDATSRFKASK